MTLSVGKERMKLVKIKPEIILPLEKGEKVIQISSSTASNKGAENFHALTNKGKVFCIYLRYNYSTVAEPDGYGFERLL